MANQTVSIPEELKYFFSFVPENAVLFGGAIRDLISGKKEVKDIDLLFKNEKDVSDFFKSFQNSYKNKISYSSLSENTTYYLKGICRYKLCFGFDGKNYEIDCVVAKDQTHAFLSDYDVNSLYGKVSKDSVEILGSITSDNPSIVIKNIKNKIAQSRFLVQTKDKVKDYRADKLSRKGFSLKVEGDFSGSFFLSSKEIFQIFQAVKNEVSESSKTNNSNKEDKKMTNSNKSFSSFITGNLVEGAYAGAAASTIDNLAKGLLVGMKKAGLDDASLMMAEMMMNHPMGKSLLAMMVGSGIELLPIEAVQNNPHIKKIGEKCIQNAGSEGVQFALEGAMKYVLPALMNAIQSTPQLSLLEQVNSSEKLRVPTSASANKEEDIPDLNEANPITNLLKNIKQSA